MTLIPLLLAGFLGSPLPRLPLSRLFEGTGSGTSTIPDEGRVRRRGRPPAVSSALCYPKQTRPRGCESLTSQGLDNLFDRFSLAELPLPCVQNGTCPYLSFRCSRGHVWKAVPGSPVCFHCPECGPKVQQQRIRATSGLSRPAKKEKLSAEVQAAALAHGGACLGSGDLSWNTKVPFRCAEGHIWEATPANILKGNQWCRLCWRRRKTLSLQKLQATAAYFGGQYLGPCEQDEEATESQRRHRWRCSEGHEFVRTPNHIRRRPGAKHPCYWCPECTSAGKVFTWNPS